MMEMWFTPPVLGLLAVIVLGVLTAFGFIIYAIRKDD